MLVDSVQITLKAGKGGDGKVSWRREKFVPMGGPDGGDGGRGGSIYLVADNNLDTLSSFRYRKVFQAEDGENGGSKKMAGSKGEDLELLVPVGTLVTDAESGQTLIDLTTVGQKQLIVRGGRGGWGNPHFATATHQRPTESIDGEPGEVKQVRLELQLIADVALLGEPNAGKSSILAAITGVEARIGAYAFSTAEPLLGVMNRGDKKITMVDLPGLLEGAHQGKGLGDQFLKHVRRVKGILHVVDATLPIANSRDVIRAELKLFDPKLTKLPFILVCNKIDLLSSEEQSELKKQHQDAVFISAKTKAGLDQLESEIINLVGA